MVAAAVLLLVLGAGGAFAYLSFLRFYFPGPGDSILEVAEVGWGERKVVTTAYREENRVVPGAYYVFESVDGAGIRREIMTFRHDDPVPINRQGIVLLNESTAYVYMGWMYAVTTNGGSSWQIWDASKNLPEWTCCPYGLIQEVRLSPDGRGTMIINRRGEVSELHTVDHGRSWHVGG